MHTNISYEYIDAGQVEDDSDSEENEDEGSEEGEEVCGKT